MNASARPATVIGASGSLAFMIYSGRHAPPLLLVMFVFWVLSPYVLLWWANRAAARWAAPTRSAVQFITLVVSVGSVAVYARDTLGPPHPQAAFVYTVIPPASWLLIALVVGTAARTARRR